MFDWLRELVTQLWDRLLPFFIVHPYQKAGVLRLGNFHRIAHTGFHWKWPLLEEVMEESVVPTTLALEAQTITTKDNKTVMVCGIVRYRISDVKLFICEVWNAHDVLRDFAMGAVMKEVRSVELRELLDSPPESKIAASIRRQVKPYGMEVEAFTFTDAAGNVRTIRLVTHTHAPEIW